MPEILHSQIFKPEGKGVYSVDNALSINGNLLILHGLFGSSSNWRSIAKQLSKQLAYTVHTLDLSNHGQSFWSDEVSYPAMAKDVFAYMQAHQLDRVTILGHSMGGKVAMQMALQMAVDQPQRLAALLVADIAPVAYQHDHSDLVKAMQALPLEQISNRREANEAMSALIADVGVRQFLLQSLSYAAGEIPKWRINLDALANNMPALFNFPTQAANRQYNGPTLFIRGEQSNYVQEKHHAAMRQYFPHHQLRSITNAGHWLHAEQTKQFMQDVIQFLSPEAGKA